MQHQVKNLVREWSDTTDGTASDGLHELFAAQAGRTPEAVAVVDAAGAASTYEELAGRVNQLARHLRRLGVGPEVRVGVCLERTPDLVTALLAVLTAGGAYVPLDPGYPAERLRFMMEDSGAAVLITERAIRQAIEEAMSRAGAGAAVWPGEGCRRVDLAADAPAIAGESAAPLPPRAVPGNLAYLIYTSGSTGRPKGVAIEHRNAVQLLAWAAPLFPAEDLAGVLAVTSICFDLSVFELFLPLTRGGRVVLVANALALGQLPPRLRETVTLVNTVPSAMAELVRAGALPRSVRTVCLAGEPLKGVLAQAIYAAAGVERVFNLYGPSESTTYSTWALVPRGDLREPSIGVPVDGTWAYVAGEDGQPVPQGVSGPSGELYLGGAGLARGYLGRPELTAERFVPDPFAAVAGERLYRTGDRVRHRAGGELEFLGRLDHQVKVRGFRIELGEIEVALVQHPAVRDAVVVVRPDALGEGQLVAYAEADPPPAASDLQAWLAQRLPAFMVPSVCQVLPVLPRTLNGKIDRRALPDPAPLAAAAGRAPATGLESILAELAGPLLGVEGIAADADLVALGAHSLLLAQLVTRVRQRLEIDLSPADVFEARTLAALAGRIEARRLDAERPLIPAVRRAPREGELPLSFSQERLWFVEQLSPGNLAYNFQFSLRFRGPFEPRALSAACTEIVRRHEIFRTTFPALAGRPVQVVHPPFAVAVPVVDLRALTPAGREAEAERRLAQALQVPFHLESLPLVRWILFQLAEEDHVLLLIEHHFVHDAWSIALLQNELRTLYRAAVEGHASGLPELEVQYADFAVWQRDWLQGAVLERQLEFWRQRLAGAPPALDLPADRPRPGTHSFRGGSFSELLPADLHAALRRLGRQGGGSLFITMLAAFATLLHRLSAQDDVLVSTGIANRRLRELEALIGMFVNTVVVRSDVGGSPSFREMVERTRQRVLELHAYQDTPFERLVAWLRPERQAGPNPLYQVMFAFLDAPMPELRFGDGLATELRYRHNGSAKTDLNVLVIPRAEQRRGLPPGAAEEEMLLVWEYSTDLFDRSTALRQWRGYLALLAAAAEDPGRPLDELPLLAAAERHQLLAEWNDRAMAPAAVHELSVHELFAAQAARTPEAVAVASGAPGSPALTYAGLDRQANQLAHRLRRLGVGTESVAAVLAGRSAAMVVANLAVLKAGGAYLPLDPELPVERLRTMLRASGARVLIGQERLLARLGGESLPVVTLEDSSLASEPADDPRVPPDPEALAYVIFTSGSTGEPKGVAVPHRGLSHLAAWHRRAYDVGPADRASSFAGLSFDAAVWEIWPYLAAGASLHLVPEEVRLAPARLLEWLAAEGVTLAFLPTPVAERVLVETPPAGLALRALLTGGDRLGRRGALGLPFTLVNHYGPTENSVVATSSVVAADAAGDGSGLPPPIGRPLEHVQAHLLDGRLHMVPFGVPGEVFLGGGGLARGYLGQPDATAERFLPDPFGAPGGRLYRTGDLARHRGDGELQFLGRADHQVKVHGLRIELGEIEAVLARHPGVRQAVAGTLTGGGDAADGVRLVAWLVAAGTELPADAELRDWLRERLPAAMIPSAFVPLASLPLTPNGKVDRKALPAPAGPARAAAFVPPAGGVEESLAEIWSDVLAAGRVGALDDFFALGGHSLLAARMMAQVQEALAVRLPLRVLFERPTVRALAVAVEGARGESAPAPPSLRLVARDRPLPLSFAQQRMWFLDQLEPGNAAYNVGFAFRLSGPLSPPALAAALDGLAARHEALRTTYPSAGGLPAQRVAAGPWVPVTFADLSGLPAARLESEAWRRSQEEAASPCDLVAGPPLRAVVLRLAADDHVLLVLSHHIVLDGSAALFLRELGTFYAAAARGESPSLPPLPFQYADFADWQRRWLTGEVLEGQLAYWRRQLGGERPPLQLPTDRPRPAVRGTRGALHPFVLAEGLGDGMRALARQHGVTLYMALLAAFEVLLCRYSGQDDLCVGLPLVDRPHPDLEGVIGCFVNTLALRTSLAGAPRFSELLGRVRETTLDAYAHKDVPFEILVDALAGERDPSHTPLFQVMFLAHATTQLRLDLPAVAAAALPLASGGTRFDWLVMLRSEGSALSGQVEYSRELFDPATIARLTGHLERLLAGILASPEATLPELPLLNASERHQLLGEWNDTAQEVEGEGLIHQRVEEQAARTPEAVAVVDDRVSWTYRELEERANQLAHLLSGLGLRPGDTVGVHVERSAEMVAALLAVLKAGGTYIPLDAAMPAERLRWIAARLATRHLVTSRALWERLGAGASFGGVVLIDGEAASALPGRTEIAAPPRLSLPPDAPAYVIFTSGSTGVPKGVTVSHRAVCRLIDWINRDFGVGPDDRVLFLTSMGFDLSVYDMFGLLAAGGSVRVVSQEEVRDAERLLAILLAEPITFWDSAPAALQQLVPFLAAAPPPGARSLRRVFLSGDWIPTALPDRVRAAFPAARVIALGGATEATVWSNVFPVAAVEPWWVSVPYGRPMPAARYYVLDERFEPCPAGVEGDLYIAGDCLAMGYAAEPGLTAERFVPDPFAPAGGRLYATGDRARFFADGNLEFLGRRDQQVKIRGFRVELGEIETVLAQHPAVSEAVVIADGAAGERSLVAYVVPRTAVEGPVALEALREHLAAHLPEYMVPAAIVALAALPLTANGKLDRKALPRPDRADLSLAAEAVAPRNAAEEVLARVWREVLGVPAVGVFDDFFDLGGHSLLATQVLARVRDALGIELPLRAFFESPTIASLVARVAAPAAAAGDPAETSSRLVPRTDAGPPPLSFAQQRLWFLDQMEPGSALYNIPFGVRLRGGLDGAALQRALEEIVRRHETLRAAFPSEGGRPSQEIRAAAAPLPRIDLRASSAAGDLDDAATAFAAQPFDLAAGPPARFALAALGAEEHLLLVNLHHIAADGSSIGIFLDELAALYGAFAAGRPSPLPEPPLQYADFAAWQRGWLQGDLLAAQLGYWRSRLAGAPPALALPTDRPRPPVARYRGGRRAVELAPRQLDDLRQLGRQAGATLFMALLAAFQALLAYVTGETDVPVGSPVAGRGTVEVERAIGFFANTLVLRGDLGGDPSFRALLAATRESALAAFAHQDVPFEQLVEQLVPERDLSRAPLFQVLFALQPAGLEPLRLPGLDMALEGIETGLSKYDLSLVLTESGAGLEDGLIYDRDLFDAATAERLARRFGRLLAAAVALPDQPLSALSLLSPQERHAVLVEVNDNGGVAPGWDGCLHEIFARRAAERPDAVAVTVPEGEGESLTYGELDRRAEGLARRLRAAGVGPGALAGIFLERSAELVVAMLGILKAGGGYVPLDPQYPAERLAYILEDAGVKAVVARGEIPAALGAVRAPVIDPDGPAPSAAPDSLPDAPGITDSVAYVIYTSGSTGRPKGVAVTHHNAVRLLAAAQPDFGFGAGDVWTLFHSSAFDFSVWEIWGALLHGGRLAVVPFWVSRTPEAFLRLLAEERVTVLNQTPSAFRQLAQADRAAGTPALPDLRWVVFGGEALDPRSLAGWFARRGDGAPRLVNMYGITETTVHVTWRPLSAADAAGTLAGPIGRPLPDLRAYVLDAALRPVPLGTPGEIYVGGEGLARGYLERPALTAERFLPDPFDGRPGRRLYRTGDQARWLCAGELEYLGRVDQQVKIRGFRIELGEIEAVLAGHPEVRDAVVMVRGEGGGKQLVAYLRTGLPAGSGEWREPLRGYLRERLPDAMIPAAFVAVEAFPATPSGKVDRRALAALAPRPEEPAAGRGEAPRTPHEELVASVFAAVLGRPRVGPADDFFALGGHSLLATQVVSRLRTALGIDLPLRELFEHPRAGELAQRLEQRLRSERGAACEPPLVPAATEAERRRAPLSFAQERLWIVDCLQPDSPVYNVSLACELRGRLDGEVLRRSLKSLVERHAALRTRFELTAEGPVQIVEPPRDASLRVVDLSSLDAAERPAETRRRVEAEGELPFDLAGGPLLRALLLRLDAAGEHHVLALGLHHIVADGWSVNILFRELAALYNAGVRGEMADLPALPVQYADFARWQRAWAAAGGLAPQLAYWRRQLAGAPAFLELPVDRPRPPVQTHGGRRSVHVPEAGLRARLRDLARGHDATFFMVLLAGFQALLMRWSGQEDLAVGTPVANRSRAETEGLVGFFANTLVLRAEARRGLSFAGLVAGVRRVALEAYEHQDLSFEHLVEALNPQRDVRYSPLFQVMLSYQESTELSTALDGLSLAPFEVDPRTAKFDLSLLLDQDERELRWVFEHNADLFDAATAARLGRQLETLLAGAAAQPALALGELPLLAPGERAQLLREWNDTATGAAPPLAPELLAAHAAATPGAVAARRGEETLSFGELEVRSDRLAHRLRDLGVTAETPVGLHLDRCLDLLPAILGIWKAGGAFVPLPPDHPPQRLAYLLDDAGIRVLVSRAELAATLPEHGAAVVSVDALDVFGGHPAEPLAAALSAESLAYVLYTSGSTGRPKGTLVSHGALANYLAFCHASYPMEGGAPVYTSLSFDLTLTSLLAPPSAGRPMELLADGHSLELLAAAVRGSRETGPWGFVKLTPAHLELLNAELGTAGAAGASRALLLGGEALRLERLAPWRTHAPAARLINEYGPTEAVVGCSTYEVRATDAPAGPVPIGRPIAGARLHVLGAGLDLLPSGSAGELCVGGAGLARGYLGRPALTAERFVPDPFSPRPGGRLYRTGDRARHRGDGVLEFLGRLDQQVKVHGYRIEPGEIESALERQPGVRAAAVAVRDDLPGGRGLAAYWTAAPGEAGAEPEALRRALASELPAYMVPASFTRLAELPLDRHGKVDARALPAPVTATAAPGVSWAAPESAAEHDLAALVAEVLGLARVGRDDNFFDLGAHSLTLVRLHERLRGRESVENAALTVIDLFRHPTVRGLAERLEGQAAAVAAGAERTGARTAVRDQRQQRRERRQGVRGA